jgi:F-type H+-transporting ATPase subunit epsilon
MYLEIITPDQEVFKGEISKTTLPGSQGSLQILKDHAPLISALDKGKVVYVTDNTEKELEVEGGVVEVLDNQVTVLVEKIVDGR